MGTTKEDISNWIKYGQEQGATHMIVVCDTFDWEDYPVYVMPTEDVHQKFASYHGPNMQKVMEVYNLQKDTDIQLKAHRAFEF
jgi:hypothetical protein